ncbi:calaxin-like [Topomyia yanbarensis]|uniref:calaxin-like n=1 Tax=Topomyia yanbarensis TaxID=2498891 RepID=UPI00273B15EF|nr:calaxin-like [Topomyia yanbarensis]
MSLDSTLDPREEVRFLSKVNRLVRRLVKRTHFTTRELEACLLIYYKLVRDDETNQGLIVGRHQLDMVFDMAFGISDGVTVARIYNALDKGVTSHVTMEQWVLMLSLFLRGTIDEKIDHCFKVYDIGGEGVIRREHMLVLLKGSFVKEHEEDADEENKDLAEIILRKLDMDRDGAISRNDFREAVRKEPEFMECFGQALPDRAHVYAFSRTFLEKVPKF